MQGDNSGNHHEKSPDDLMKSLGASTWAFMHTVAAQYPVKPSLSQQQQMRQLINGIARFYPCSYCAHDFRHSIRSHPVQVDNREKLSVWVCERHNEVNEKLGKPVVSCDRIWEKWGAHLPKIQDNIGSRNDLDDEEDNNNELLEDDGDNYDDEDDDDDVLPDDCDFCEKTMGKERFLEMKKMLSRKK